MKKSITAKSPRFTYNPNNRKIWQIKVYKKEADAIEEIFRRRDEIRFQQTFKVA